MDWFIQNWQEIGSAILMLLGAASIIAKLTPSKSDDKVINAIIGVVQALGLNKKK
jgi:putative Mn2+ efflux pump MntP